MSKNFKLGALLVIFAAVFWGASGVLGQYIFQVANFPPVYVTTLRLICSGVVFLIITLLKGEKTALMSIFKNKNDLIYMGVYGIAGIMMVQLTYFLAINYSNASTATILQYVCPAMIMVYFVIKNRKLPNKIDVIAIIFAMAGIFLVSTHGNLNQLSISPLAFFWGIVSAVAMSVNTIMPVRLVKKYSSPVVMSWSMIWGGAVLGIFSQAWNISVVWDIKALGVFLCIVFLGTVAAFYCFFEGVKIIGAGKGSLFVSIEPIMATVFTVIFMGASFEFLDYIGLLCITVMLILVAIEGDEKNS